jgi:hypothetical protein
MGSRVAIPLRVVGARDASFVVITVAMAAKEMALTVQLRIRLDGDSTEMRPGSLQQYVVDVDVHLLVVEAGEPGNLLALWKREPIDPDEVRIHALARVG